MRSSFVRRSAARFMPGESLDDVLPVAVELERQGLSSILTRLGENVTTATEAEAVTTHYLHVLEKTKAIGLPAQISIKPTQLGLDLDRALCLRQLHRLVDHAEAAGTTLWIDMESSAYVDETLTLYRQVRARSTRVGVCLQAYLRRTADDLDALLPLAPAIRLVKGAYREPPDIAFPRKRDVDDRFFDLACRLLDHGRRSASFTALATHDEALIARIMERSETQALPPDRYELAMLYGINTAAQRRLNAAGAPVRILISYGDYWFPWYMRRLAERPANLWFVAKNLLAR